MVSISVIIPVFNAEKYISDAIMSFLNQSFQDYELIIIDDGSTDRSKQVISQYNDERIVFVSVSNGGPSKARNIGLQMSRGMYILFADADDIVSEDYLSIMYEQIQGGDADIAICRFKYIHDNPSNSKGEYSKNAFTISKENIKYYQKAIFTKQFYNSEINKNNVMYGAVWGKLFKRSLIIDNNILFNENINLGEDNLFMLSAYERSNSLIYVDSPLVFYRVGIDSIRKKHVNYEERLENFTRYILETDKFVKCYHDDEEFCELLVINRANVLLLLSVYLKKDDCKNKKGKYEEIRTHSSFNDLFNGNMECLIFPKAIFVLLFKYRIWFLVELLTRLYDVISK